MLMILFLSTKEYMKQQQQELNALLRWENLLRGGGQHQQHSLVITELHPLPLLVHADSIPSNQTINKCAAV
jgi:hypothetical protein